MPVSLPCPHECKKNQEPWLDPDSNKVYCSLCEKEIQANHFLIIQLKTLKQYKPKNSAFLVKCLKCKKESTPQKNKNNDILCGICGKNLDNLSDVFKRMLITQLDEIKKEI